MKRCNELTDEELLGLTDDQILKLVDYECALEGVPMLPTHPGPAPKKREFKEDDVVYAIGGVYVADSEHAKRILDVINEGPLFTIETAPRDYATKLCVPLGKEAYHKPKIETVSCHSPEQWDHIKDTFAAYTTEVDAYTAKLKEYDEAFNERKDISENVWEAVRDAKDRDHEKSSIRYDFDRYLELTEGNKTIAMNFLIKAKGSVQYNYKEIVQELCPGYGMPVWLVPVCEAEKEGE